MLESIVPSLKSTPPPAAPAATQSRDRSAELVPCMAQMLDEIDYGMLLVDTDDQVLYLNHAARTEMDRFHPLQLLGRSLRAGRPADVAPLSDALVAARRGLRRMLLLGEGEHRVSLSVVPLGESRDGTRITMLALGKREVCQALSVQGFARSLALTPTETRVLELLCSGVSPTAVATRQGVAVSTVRTQIGSIRAKSGAGSIRELVRQVAVLPPMVGSLRGAVWRCAAALGEPAMATAA